MSPPWGFNVRALQDRLLTNLGAPAVSPEALSIRLVSLWDSS